MIAPFASLGAARRACHSFHAALVMALLLGAVPAYAQSWIPVGAPGGNVRSLAADPSRPERVYLGTAEGILYRSDDAGARWTRLDPGFPCRGCSLDEIKVDSDGTVYVGYWEVHGAGGGVARSTDGGASFTLLQGIQGESVRALAIAPSNDRVIAAGTLTGVFLSKNGGQSWVRISPAGHPDLRNIESLAFDPDNPRVLLAGTWHLTWKTVNGGAAWAAAHDGIIDDSDVMTLTVDRRSPRALFATGCSGIYHSADGGARWTKLPGIPYSSRRTRAFALGDGLLLAGTTEGLFVSEDDGSTWRRATRKELVVNAVVALPGGGILLGTEGAGVLRSADRGQTWVTSNTGFSERFVFKVLFDDEAGRIVVAEWGAPHYSGVFVSPTVGGPWVRLGEGMDGRQVLSLAVLGPTLLAGTDDGVFARPPDAPAWVRLPTRIDGQEAHPRVTELIARAPGTLLAATATGLIVSEDGGRTWKHAERIDDREVTGLAASPEDPDLVIATTKSGVFRSKDGGATWSRVSDALGAGIHAVAFMPTDDRVLFATTNGGLYRSRDQGATWRRLGGGLPHSDLTGIALDPDGRAIYVSDFTWGGIFQSNDGGSTWKRMPTDGLASDHVWTLSVDPGTPGRLLAGASAGGLHVLSQGSLASRAATRGSD